MSDQTPTLSDSQLRELGVVFHDPPLPPIRETKVINGKKCRVFRSEAERQLHIKTCKVEVAKNCLDGARSACVLKAVDTCRGPAWQRWLPFTKPGGRDPGQVEACEARVMEDCQAAAAGGCTRHAEELCDRSHPPTMWLE